MPRPRLITHNVASLDGRLTIGPGVLLMGGDERWQAIAGDGDGYRDVMARHEPQAVLEGSGSFVSEDAEPTPWPEASGAGEHHGHFLPADVVDVRGRRWFTVVDGRGRIRWQFKEFPDPEWAGWHLLVLVAESTPAEYLAYLRGEAIPYLVVGSSGVDLPTAVETLGRELGVEVIVSTGGGRLNGALLRAGLVDRIEVEILPAVIGSTGTPALFDAPPLGPADTPTRLRPAEVSTTDDGHVLLTYDVPRG